MKKVLYAAITAALLIVPPAFAADTTGVTATEVKIGATFPFSGPASGWSGSGKGIMAYVNYLNDKGGINGRKISFIALDDAYSPPKTVEQTRRLVDNDGVSFIFGTLGTPTNTATAKYLASKKVPQVFILTGASKFTNVPEYPVTTTGVPSYETEGRIFARHISDTMPNAKVALLYQNDDLGKDYLNAFKVHFGDDFARKVSVASYEVADPTIDSQIVNLKGSGAEVLFLAAAPKFAAQAIRKSHEIGFKPTIMLSQVASSIGATLTPAGLDISKGVMSSSRVKDVTDPKYKDDAAVKWYREFMAKYAPGVDISDAEWTYGVNHGMLLEYLLRQCGNDLSRENVLKQSKNLKEVSLPLLAPGIKLSTSETNNQAFTQLQLQRFNGTSWETFGAPVGVVQEAKAKK